MTAQLNPFVQDKLVAQDAPKKVVQVFGPGGGTFQCRDAFQAIDQDLQIAVEVVGSTFSFGAPYDKYPDGHSGPNHHTFAQSVIDGTFQDYFTPYVVPGHAPPRLGAPGTPLLEAAALFFGSRGGQMVLPYMWSRVGDALPPVVIVNAGPTQANIPFAEYWPPNAIVFLLVCGSDETFKNQQTAPEEYFRQTLSGVPTNSARTAVLFVKELFHMPDDELMMKVYPHMTKSVIEWKEAGEPNTNRFQRMVETISSHRPNPRFGTSRYTGEMRWKHGTDQWQVIQF
jgi:hypothetical protein